MSNTQHVSSLNVEVREEWQSKTLGELAEFINGRAFKPVDWEETGIPIIRIQNLNGSNEFNYYQGEIGERHKIHNNDLLFSWSGSRGTSFGPHIWKGEDGVLNQHIFKVKINKAESLDKYYFYYALKGITQLIEKDAHGSAGLVHITKKNLEGFSIPVPLFQSQQKIASILSSVDKAIEKTEAIIEQTEKVKKGLMQQLLTKGIGHTKFKKTEIGEVPEEWEVKVFSDVMVLQRGFDLPTHSRKEGQYPLMSANGLTDSHSEYKVEGPGIVTGRSGTIGKVHYIEANFWPLNTTLYVKEMYENNPKFLYYLLSNFRLERFSTGTGVPTLNRNIVHIEKIALPPVDEQQKIALILTNVDMRMIKEKQYLQELLNLKKGLMQSLLTGRVRVKVDEAEVTQV